MREAGIVASQAVLIAVGIDWDGRRQILAVEMANRESRSAWKVFLVALKGRGLKGVELVVSDDHAGLVAAIGEVIPEAARQRCYVHFLRNALDHLPSKHGDDCLQELRWLYDRRDLAEAKADLAAWLSKWSGRYPRLMTWVEETIERTLTFFCLPRQRHKHLESTNILERLNEEIRRRTYVVRIFPNAESCLRLVRALAVETNKTGWRSTDTSTWTTCASTRSSLCAKLHDQLHGRPVFAELDAQPTSPSDVMIVGGYQLDRIRMPRHTFWYF